MIRVGWQQHGDGMGNEFKDDKMGGKVNNDADNNNGKEESTGIEDLG